MRRSSSPELARPDRGRPDGIDEDFSSVAAWQSLEKSQTLKHFGDGLGSVQQRHLTDAGSITVLITVLTSSGPELRGLWQS
jgi:hypothetical protein